MTGQLQLKETGRKEPDEEGKSVRRLGGEKVDRVYELIQGRGQKMADENVYSRMDSKEGEKDLCRLDQRLIQLNRMCILYHITDYS